MGKEDDWGKLEHLEAFAFEGGYDIPISDARLDAEWIMEFNIRMAIDFASETGYYTKLAVGEWYKPTKAMGSYTSDEVVFYKQRGPGDISYIKGLVCLIGNVKVADADEPKIASLLLMDVFIAIGQDMSNIVDFEDFAAVPVVDLPGMIKLTRD